MRTKGGIVGSFENLHQASRLYYILPRYCSGRYSAHWCLLVSQAQPGPVVIEIGRSAEGPINRRIATFSRDAVDQNCYVFLLGKVSLCHHDGPPSLRDIGLSPEVIAAQDTGWVGEYKDCVFCRHMAGAVSTLHPETFFHIPKGSIGFHGARTVGFAVSWPQIVFKRRRILLTLRKIDNPAKN